MIRPIAFPPFDYAIRHLAVADWSGDGHADLLVVDATTSALLYYPNQNDRPDMAGWQTIGFGFTSFRHVVAADWSGDGKADVIASDSNGALWYYPHEGNGLGPRKMIGTSGWQDLLFVRAMDFSGDGHADILGVSNVGNLYYYPHQGDGLAPPRLLGTGWGPFTIQNLL